MASIESRLTRFSKIYVLVPVLFVLCALNVLVAWVSTRAPAEDMKRLREGVESDVSTGLRILENETYRISVNALVKKSIVDAEARYKDLRRRNIDLESIISSEANQSRETVLLETFLNNHALTKLIKSESDLPEVRSMVLTDGLGRLVAATHRPRTANLSNSGWWKEAKRLGRGEGTIEGFSEEDTLVIAMPVYLKPDSEISDGVLRVEYTLNQVLSYVDLSDFPLSSGAVFVRRGSENLHKLAIDPEAIEEHGTRLVRHVSKQQLTDSWYKGARFSARKIPLPESMETPINVVVFAEQPLMSASTLSPLIFSLLGSAIIVVIVNIFGQRAALAVGGAVADVTNAGQWLLWRVQPERFTQLVGRGERNVLQNPTYNDWLDEVKQSVLDTMVSHEHEVQRDLQMARDFQFAYHNRPYPKVPINHLPGRLRLRFAHEYHPALALGGDFFEIGSLGPDVGSLLICDVMGHGTRSALITSMLRTLMADLKGQGRNTRNFLREMNRSFYTMLQQLNLPHPLFASAFYFVADTTARAATFSTAGHPAPFHIRRSANTVDRLQVAPPHGAAMGVSLEEEYTGGSCRLTAGDVFIFYTDGVYEAFSPHGEEFGMQRLEKLMRQSIHNSLEDTVGNLRTAIHDFTEHEPLRDDICILGIEVTEEADTGILA